MALTRIKTNNILDGQVFEGDLANGSVTFYKLAGLAGGSAGHALKTDGLGNLYWELPSSSLDTLTDVDTSTVPPISGDALVWNGIDNWVPFAIAGLGASSNTFVVADIAARDALSAAEGDQAFVRAGTSSEYELYIWDAAWILVGTADSARTDANTIEAIINFDGTATDGAGNVLPAGSPVLLGNISNNSRVTTVSIEVLTIFDGTDPAPKLSIGDAVDNGRIIGADPLLDYLLEPDFDLKVAGTYTLNVGYVYDGVTDTDINAYFDFTGSTQGQMRVIVTHV